MDSYSNDDKNIRINRFITAEFLPAVKKYKMARKLLENWTIETDATIYQFCAECSDKLYEAVEHFLREAIAMDINEMCRKLLKLPHAKTVEPEKLKETIEEAVKNLESVFLIGKVSTLILEKNVRYKISERGLKVRGYILSMESFKTLYDAIKNSQKEDGIYFFDLFYYLTNTEEIIKDEVRPEKGAWKESDDRTNPVVQFIRHSASWEERGIISSELKNKITEKIEIGILYMGDKLRIWKTIFLILRIESRNERYVFNETKMENGIGQRFSESISFLLDCLNAYVTATKSFEKYCTILGILSQAVFYGVNPDVLQAEPELAKDIVANKKRLQNLSRIYCNNINKR